MALQEQFESQGNYLFKRRGHLPIYVILIGMAVFAYYAVMDGVYPPEYYKFICLFVCLIGLVVRIVTVGFTPQDTSGRNTEQQDAEVLNTQGIYATIRHPLYFGNFFMMFGVAMLTFNLWFIAFFFVLYWFYYERIMYAEEQFLRGKFGQAYLDWADKTPAIIPNLSQWKSSNLNFSMRKILRQEKNGFFAIFLLIFLFETLGEYLAGRPLFSNDWIVYSAIASGAIYLILKLIKYNTKWLNEAGR